MPPGGDRGGHVDGDQGRALLAKLADEASRAEVDKYTLHVEEVDKITSLILGLSSRLAKTENALAVLKRGTWDEDEEVSSCSFWISL